MSCGADPERGQATGSRLYQNPEETQLVSGGREPSAAIRAGQTKCKEPRGTARGWECCLGWERETQSRRQDSRNRVHLRHTSRFGKAGGGVGSVRGSSHGLGVNKKCQEPQQDGPGRTPALPGQRPAQTPAGGRAPGSGAPPGARAWACSEAGGVGLSGSGQVHCGDPSAEPRGL